MKKKIIGVLARPTIDDENDSLVALYQDVRSAILKKGGIPFIISPLNKIDYKKHKYSEIPNLTEDEKEELKNMVDVCDALIIPGGYTWYNYDEFVAKYAIEKDIPVLGICMGMQLLATLYTETRCLEKNHTNINHRQREKDYVHKVEIIEETKLNKIVETSSIKVNSKHNSHIDHVDVFKVSAYSEDGLIEAIELEDKKFVIGVQWHPEKMLDYDIYANKILDEFMKSIK